MADKEKVIAGLMMLADNKNDNSCEGLKCCKIAEDALALIKKQDERIKELEIEDAISRLIKHEAREPHYTTLKYLVNGTEVIVHHPECPRCIENGLALWDAEIEKGQAFCKRCGQAVKWE